MSSMLVKRDNLKQMYPSWEAMTHQMHHHKLRTKNPKGMTEVMQQKKKAADEKWRKKKGKRKGQTNNKSW